MNDSPDFYSPRIMIGGHGSGFRTVHVDADGNMIAMLKALFGGTPTALQCDVDGNIQINLNAQALGEVVTRNKYGQIYREDIATTCPGLVQTELFSQNGKGVIYGMVLRTGDIDYTIADTLHLTIDGEVVQAVSWGGLMNYNLCTGVDYPITLTIYDLVTPNMAAVLGHDFTFETNVTLKYFPWGVNDVDVVGEVLYALIA